MKYKEFDLIGSSFKCNKNCPYCTAKITKWPIRNNNFKTLENRLNYLKEKDISFRYFIFGGNGEPSMNSFEDIKTVVDATRKVNLFDEKRFQSSGNVFFEDEKFNYIKDDFIIEITRVSLDPKEDMNVLGYKENYLETDNFKKANIRLNYVLIKNRDFNQVLKDLQEYIKKYPNIKTVSLKTLNTSTKDDVVDNKYSKWILENALTKKDTDKIVEFMTNNMNFSKKDEKFFDRYEWIYKGVPITFYAKKLDYGYSNVVYYGGELVDYNLKPIVLKDDKKW